jgi:phosphatidylglycerol:prolipoprotein diacylglycerol transferase
MFAYFIAKHIQSKDSYIFWLNFFDNVYHILIIAGITIAIFLFYKRMLKYDYDKKKILIFILLLVPALIIFVPLGSRIAMLFYTPSSSWNIDFFYNEFINGKRIYTAHGSLVGAIIAISSLVLIMKFKYKEVMDTFFLYVPLVYIFGRTGCFLVGCCWGRPFELISGDIKIILPNPVPLYEIMLNAIIFLTLRFTYNRIYLSDKTELRKNYGLLTTAIYLFLYNFTRIFIEEIRMENIIAYGLTQAQIVSIVFVIFSLCLFIYIYIKVRICRVKEDVQIHSN